MSASARGLNKSMQVLLIMVSATGRMSANRNIITTLLKVILAANL